MKEMLIRALRTFLQAAVGYLAANIVVVISAENIGDVDYLRSAICGLVCSSIAAGLAAIMNLPSKNEKQ